MENKYLNIDRYSGFKPKEGTDGSYRLWLDVFEDVFCSLHA